MTKHTTELTDTSTPLKKLGWNESFELRLATLDAPTLASESRIARIMSVQRGSFLVADGREETLCAPSGNLMHGPQQEYPVTGDWVLMRDKVVTTVIPRKNLLSRAASGSRGNRDEIPLHTQAIAANIDTVFIVCGLDRDFNIRRLERYLTLVHNCGLAPVVVLTKADLHEETDRFVLEVESVAFGAPVVATSMQDKRGISALESFLGIGQTVAMIGSSGAGKSTLANLLHGSAIQTTGAVSDAVGKGRHTTTVREIIAMPQGGLLVDNPGIREIGFHDDGQGMDHAFADIAALARECRFPDCHHQQEPDCAVTRAVASGDLARERLSSYHKMQKELRYHADRSTKSADRLEKERWKGIAKLQKQMKRRKR